MISLIISLISTIMFIVGGIIGTSKLGLKIRWRIGLTATYLIANFLWTIYCYLMSDWIYIWVGIFYIGLGILGLINFTRIYKKLKKDENYIKLV